MSCLATTRAKFVSLLLWPLLLASESWANPPKLHDDRLEIALFAEDPEIVTPGTLNGELPLV